MRRTLTIALGTAVALATAAATFAVVPAVVGVSATTATFSTSKIEESRSRTCTVDARTWEITKAHYAGDIVSANAALNGSLSIHARTRYNTTDKLGYVDGSFRVNEGDSRLKGEFAGTIKDGKLVGFLIGRSHGNDARVLGNLSATFAGGATNFADGAIGAGSSTAVLAVVTAPACRNGEDKPKQDEQKSSAKRAEVNGEITGLEAGPPPMITVTSKKGPAKCAVDSAYAIPAGFTVGTKDVEMTCERIGDPGVWTLRKLEKHTSQ